jgi:hypothetical protein
MSMVLCCVDIFVLRHGDYDYLLTLPNILPVRDLLGVFRYR